MEPAPLELSCLQVHDLLSAQEDVHLIDCREAQEHQLVAIKGSTLLPMSEMTTRVKELEPHRERRIVVYCHHGMRSAQTVAWLREQGFATAQSMAGGIDEWAVEIEPGMQRY